VRSRDGFSRLNDELVAARGRGLMALDAPDGGRRPLAGVTELERLAREYTSAQPALSRQERIERLLHDAAPMIRDFTHRRRVILLFGLGGDSFASATQLRKLAVSTLNEQGLSKSALVVRDRRAFASLEVAIAELLEGRNKAAGIDEESRSADAVLSELDMSRAAPTKPFFLVPPRDSNFVNRERELDDLSEATAGSARQPVFLVGMGGVGKSATAVEFAHSYRRRFRDGVVWVEPGSAKIEDVLYGIAQAFGRGREFLELTTRARRMSFVQSLFAGRRTLVIFNDVGTRTQLRPLLMVVSGSHILVTTRNRGLAYGQPAASIDIGPLALDPALLLLEHLVGAQRIAEDADAARSLCELTGFLPLALRIIAARIVRSSASVADHAGRLRARRIGDELQLTALSPTGVKDFSVWSSIGLSYDELSAPQRLMFSAIGVFENGDFSASAMASVLEMDEPAAIRMIEDLCALSLVERGISGRWRIHPLVAQFGIEIAPPSRDMHLRLVAFVAELAETAARHMRTSAQGIWMGKLEIELGTITTAAEWAHQAGQIDDEARILSSLLWFWLTRGLHEQVHRRIEELAETVLPIGTRTAVLQAACYLASDRADFVAGFRYAQLWLEAGRGQNDQRQIAAALDRMASNAWCLGEYDVAEARAQESLAAWRQLRDLGGIATAINIRGLVHAYRSEYVEAVKDYRSGYKRWKATGDEWGMHTSLNNLGEVERCLGKLADARRHYEQSLKMRIAMRDMWSVVNSLNNLAELERAENRLGLADRYYQQAFTIALPMENLVSIATAAAGRASVQPPTRAPVAAQLLGAAETLLRDAHSRLGPANAFDYEKFKERIVTVLGRRRFAQYYEYGTKLDLPAVAELMINLEKAV
jgi:tetratricopeptide (TPR) repeat protein